MPSIIPGYEYDIFISYRQKDNLPSLSFGGQANNDGWVSEFVENLKRELEATFKEEISVYFDINPHDGLLETHDVDASLKEKLKCLIFIPVLSRTYCDPKSFAWLNEFTAFIKSASEDRFGLKVKLADGNISSRILPMRIHDLDSDDISLCESALGGVLRGIEFIYKEPGVNRPLTPDDDPKTNLNKTRYRNQINKVALAIRGIIYSMQKDDKPSERSLLKTSGTAKVLESIGEFEKSIAVLPFINDSPDQENTYFINGVMEEILNNLQKIKDLRVISRTSVEQYRNKQKPINEIAEDLDVNYIVEGSGQKYGNTFILRTQLIKAERETHLWGESYQQEINDVRDIFSLQNEIAKKIAAELKAIITPEEKQLIEKIPTENLEAYEAYLKGQFYWRKLTPKDLDTAMEYFEEAKNKDPNYAPAYAGISDVWQGRQQMGLVAPDIAGPKAFEAAMKALELDPERAEVHYTLGCMYTWGMWNWKAGEDAFNRAISLKPAFPEARKHYSHLLCILGRQKEAREQIELATSQDPASPLTYSFYAIDLVFFRQYEAAIDMARKALEMDPSSNPAYSALTYGNYLLGNYNEAIEAYIKAVSLIGINVFSDLNITAKLEDPVEIIRLIARRMVALRKESYVLPLLIAQLYAMIGDNKNTIDWLEKGFEEHDPILPYLLAPVFDNIREEQRFQEIARKMNLPYK